MINVAVANGGAKAAVENESLKNDVYTVVAYRDMEKLQRLVESQGYFVSELDGHGYYALQWAALNSRIAALQYIIAVCELYIYSYISYGANSSALERRKGLSFYCKKVLGVNIANIYGYQVIVALHTRIDLVSLAWLLPKWVALHYGA
ncbi:Hypothetical predicted protein [Olea europaea subsp. europaea]|uniref:Uncharacterized protein n=1 Tax=Olea europaea subsp. europaea TaxID=158383 RepID=A0A8S0QBC9_OLEEU|nr:Hypothetical predicted protein [Olea europaea subsp. europaea]